MLLGLAFFFAAAAVVAGLFGFLRFAATLALIGRVLFLVFAVLFVVLLVVVQA